MPLLATCAFVPLGACVRHIAGDIELVCEPFHGFSHINCWKNAPPREKAASLHRLEQDSPQLDVKGTLPAGWLLARSSQAFA